MKGSATAMSHGAHVLRREKGASIGLFTLFLLLRNTCRTTKMWNGLSCKVSSTYRGSISNSKTKVLAWVYHVIARKSV